MHFTYSSQMETGTLCQGDVLEKTDELQSLLREVHPHYCREEYTHFQVLTQSCDLVRRGRSCSARYITIAAVRSLGTVIRREVDKQASSRLCELDGDLLCSDKAKDRLVQFVSSLVNNNSKEHFFLKAAPESGLEHDSCTFLYLSIAIKAEHYDKCLKAKRIQLDDVFQSKLGWLVGNLYSRVGTPDFCPAAIEDKKEFDEFVNELLEGQLVWVPQSIFPDVKRITKDENGLSAEDAVDKAIRSATEKAEARVQTLVGLIQRVPGTTVENQDQLKHMLKSRKELREFFGFPESG